MVDVLYKQLTEKEADRLIEYAKPIVDQMNKERDMAYLERLVAFCNTSLWWF